MSKVIDQEITEKYAIYNGDNMEVLPTIPDESVHHIIYSPPFFDIFAYSSSPRDLSNCKSYEEFLKHYEFIVRENNRILFPGRLTSVHCMDIPRKQDKGFIDFPGDIIKIHEKNGFYYWGRRQIWKEPLRMAIRTRSKGLKHRQFVQDTSLCNVASADYLLTFKKHGKNKIPIDKKAGLSYYAGLDQPSGELKRKYENWDNQKTNKLSHWIWQRYASSMWNDIDQGEVLPYRDAKENEEEKHCCPLQTQVIERSITMWTNKGEVVLTPFLGVGSEAFMALVLGRKAIGIELKPTYYRQAKKNLQMAKVRENKKRGFKFN